MIAELRISRMGRCTRVCLDDNLRWCCDTDSDLANLLNEAHPMDAAIQSSAMHELYQVAARLGAEVLQAPRSITSRCSVPSRH